MNEREFADLAAGYALNALSEADERAYQEALAEHPQWTRHVRDAALAVSALSATVMPVEPPASVRSSVLARIGELPQESADAAPADDAEDFAAAGPAPVEPAGLIADEPTTDAADDDDRRSAGAWGMRRWFTLAASIVAVLVLGFGAATVSQQLTRPAAVVALERIQDAPDAQSATTTTPDGTTATAYWSASTGQSVLVAEGMATLGDDQTYELWFVRDGTPIAAGVFDTDASGEATAVLAGEYRPGDVIAVTVEPAGGSPDGTPSSDPVVVVAT